MSKLRFYYGTMNSMKSATLLMKAYQFEEADCNVILMKPAIDTRDIGQIKSRAINEGRDCIILKDDSNIIEIVKQFTRYLKKKKTIVFIDEAQFLSLDHVNELFELTTIYDIDVYAYGLKLNYKNELFEASEKLLILADTVEEIKSMCKCGNKATTHVRYINGQPTLDGIGIKVGDVIGDDRYESVCQRCWNYLLMHNF